MVRFAFPRRVTSKATRRVLTRMYRWVAEVTGDLRAGGDFHAHVEDLAAHLAGRAPADWRERWIELEPGYSDSAAALFKKSQNDN